VRELVFTSVYESYTIGSLATGRTTHAGQDLSEILDQEGYPGPPGWGLCMGLPSLPCKNSFVLKLWHRKVMTPKMDGSTIEEDLEPLVQFCSS
jgi:hypothetical protein